MQSFYRNTHKLMRSLNLNYCYKTYWSSTHLTFILWNVSSFYAIKQKKLEQHPMHCIPLGPSCIMVTFSFNQLTIKWSIYPTQASKEGETASFHSTSHSQSQSEASFGPNTHTHIKHFINNVSCFLLNWIYSSYMNFPLDTFSK